jgi:4-hydroxybenzoate polyprenyltransferase
MRLFIPKHLGPIDEVGVTRASEPSGESSEMLPLVVDLDGTLTKTDTLYESLIQLAKRSPLRLLTLPFALLKGKTALKEAVSTQVDLDVAHLPYRMDLLDYLRSERANGRRIILATAAHKRIAEKVAAHLNLFDDVLASDADRNLKGAEKLEAIRAKVGTDFCYAGDSRADLAIWRFSRYAILSGASAKTARAAKRCTTIEREFTNESASVKTWMRALRIHQWLKNLLIFVPALTSFAFIGDPNKLVPAFLAFLAFSIAASGTYIMNDLWDLQSDRQHPRKRNRPFACASLSIHQGLIAAAAALVIAFALSLLVSGRFAMMLVGYVVLTTSYSWVLKSYVLVDVLILSLLYTFRILAGSIATEIPVSSWLLAFSVFAFLSLALVKRCAELISLKESGKSAAKGRDYQVSDLLILSPMGVGAALSAVVVFGLFISSPETQSRYASPQLLWLVAIGMLYWTGRLWVKTSRGEMHDDPVVYAIKDRNSRLCFALMIGAMIIAHLVDIGSPFGA